MLLALLQSGSPLVRVSCSQGLLLSGSSLVRVSLSQGLLESGSPQVRVSSSQGLLRLLILLPHSKQACKLDGEHIF